ncbi:NAD(P)H-binding protein [Paraglaciecola aquimarina]|uniref:NAD(P)H-binding protein n=1 Tax=Paraglaciecola aquimarina TaxID=1235557 RepID=A0ABU3SUC0_9ALTE|nr:NAD(P)H-binding protein [Paraglaciecola aquimarina]MDU0353610.1 NAD(P)H-binding protein [Paraglaciecola aquimarina]
MLKTALVLGATGLVGQQLIAQLCSDSRYKSIVCLVRKPLGYELAFSHDDKLQPIVIDFAALQDYQGYFGVDHVYVCLGSTIKKAGNRKAFRKVDFEYIHVAAQLARAQHVQSFVWISSVGANAQSSLFYLRVKGELENAIFKLSGLEHASAVRPSLLLGNRKEHRLAEKIGGLLAGLLSPLFVGPFAKYKPIQAAEVATKMIQLQVF